MLEAAEEYSNVSMVLKKNFPGLSATCWFPKIPFKTAETTLVLYLHNYATVRVKFLIKSNCMKFKKSYFKMLFMYINA